MRNGCIGIGQRFPHFRTEPRVVGGRALSENEGKSAFIGSPRQKNAYSIGNADAHFFEHRRGTLFDGRIDSSLDQCACGHKCHPVAIVMQMNDIARTLCCDAFFSSILVFAA